ncbi:MAG: hypothetical protein Q9160_000957 [Pyrenula sp. 1 TL-2023]
MGMHRVSLTDSQFSNAMMWSWIADAMSRLSIGFGKVTVVAFLLEIGKKSERKWQRFFLLYIAISNVTMSLFSKNILTPLTLWSATEMWVVIIAGSIPPAWPLFRALTGSVKSQQSDKKSWRSTSTPNTTTTRKSYDRLHGADMAQSDIELGRYPGAYGTTEPISKPHLVYTGGFEN